MLKKRKAWKIKAAFCLLLFLIVHDVWADSGIVIENIKWSIIINIPQYKLDLYADNKLFKTYKVAVGKRESPSPIGDFSIITKIKDPTWYPNGAKPIAPGPRNPLGGYWLGLDKQGYGIHGSNAPYSIGSSASQGCFRMLNNEVAELYNYVTVSTPVRIIYETVIGGIDETNQAWIRVYEDIYRRVNLFESAVLVVEKLEWGYRPNYLELRRLLNRVQYGERIAVPMRNGNQINIFE